MPHLAPAAVPAGPVRRARRNATYLAVLLMDAAFAAAYLTITYHAKRSFSAGPFHLGLLSLTMAGVYVVASLLLGRLSDRWGRRRSILLGCALTAVALALTTCVRQLWHFYPLIALNAVGHGAFWPALEADISDNSTPRELTRRLGAFNVAWAGGFMAGAFGGGVLVKVAGPLVALTVCSLATVAAVLVYLNRSFEPLPLAPRPPDAAAEARATARAGAFWKIALVLNFAAIGLNNTVRTLMPEVTGPERSAVGGLYVGAMFLAQMVTCIGLSRWGGWHYRAAPLFTGLASCLGGALLCGLSGHPAVFGSGCVLVGAGTGVIYYSSIYYSVGVASARGHRGGIHEATLGAGAALVPFAGGALAGTPRLASLTGWPQGIPFLTAVAVLLLAGLVAAALYLGARGGGEAR